MHSKVSSNTLPGQLGVSEVDVLRFVLGQSIDHIAQGKQGTVNVCALFQTNSRILKKTTKIIIEAKLPSTVPALFM